MARIRPFHLTGKVWCLRVPTGAFVVRRNGKIFVTGNSGKPKTLDISKAVDEHFGAERVVIERRTRRSGGYHIRTGADEEVDDLITEPATPEAKYWDGFHTGLKPGFEPVLIARKPLDQDTIVKNVLVHGTGGLNIGANRLPPDPESGARKWPMNVLVTHHPACVEEGDCHPECATKELDHQVVGSAKFFPQFYYNGKAGKDDRYVYVECGCPEPRVMPLVVANALIEKGPKDPNKDADLIAWEKFRAMKGAVKSDGTCVSCGKPFQYERHPTVKPTNVMRWLVRLVTPKGGIVLDPFNGSGSTGVGCMHERLRYVGIEMGDKYFAIASARLTDTAEDTPPYEPPEPLRGIDEPAVPETAEVIPLPDSEALRKAFDLTEEIKVERKPGGLASKDFKRLVAKSLKR